MTRLTTALRDDMFRRIMKGLPNRNYQAELHTLVQEAVVQFMDPKLRAVYEDAALRPLLREDYARVHHGSKYLYIRNEEGRYITGLNREMDIRMADHELPDRVKEGTLYHHILFKTDLVALVKAHYEQEELREKVSKRLKANLAAATTIKKLYDILEPELHSYIPREVEGSKMLPATVAPVVDDLKKLGLVVPEVSKAEELK